MGHVFSLSNLIKAYRYLKKNGAAAAFSAVQERILQDGKNDWKYQKPGRETLEAQRKDAIASFEAMAFSEAAKYMPAMADDVANLDAPLIRLTVMPMACSCDSTALLTASSPPIMSIFLMPN